VGGPDLKLATVPGSTSGGGRRVFHFCNTHWFWVLEKIQNQRTTSSGYSENFQIRRNAGFHERTGKDLFVLPRYLVFFHFF
jgi:hypothetical protein